MDFCIKQVAHEITKGHQKHECLEDWEDVLQLDASVAKRFTDAILEIYTVQDDAVEPARAEGCVWHEHEHRNWGCERFRSRR